MYLYGFMIPFWRVSNVCKSWRTYWIERLLDPLHKRDHVVAPRVSNKWLLGDAQAVLGADAAAALRDPLVHEGLELLLDRLVEPPRRHVEVQVAVAHVAVADDVDDGKAVVAADEPC